LPARSRRVYNPTGMKDLTLQLPDELRRALEEIGRREQRPTAEVAVSLLESSLRAEEFRDLRRETLDALGPEAADTDREALDQIS